MWCYIFILLLIKKTRNIIIFINCIIFLVILLIFLFYI
uniref:Uncharacterized protein n=1 Tax=Dasya naccarioides TaxID=2007180 RepID=A0A1Z1MGD6_9FLOR|nr:hypothetical protein [Dasya naccarioides]ARW65128.1 hypothetical protein [Dasya naccarioides]